jgi:hypothetical protein
VASKGGSASGGRSTGASSLAPARGGRTLDTGKGASGSGPLVRYDHGPTKRVETPRTSPAKPSKGAPTIGTSPIGTSPKGAPSKDVGGKGVALEGSKLAKRGPRGVPADPDKDRQVFVATKLAGHASKVAVGAAAGTLGGVRAGDFRGGLDLDDDWVRDPWGCDSWSRSRWSWSWCGNSWSWWWSFPCYWSWYYPCWWLYSRPYYYYDYCYYPSVTTVVYAEPSVVYVQSPAQTYVAESGAPAAYPSEPRGEGVALPPSEPAPALAPNPLSIAAQRYLELGDRAFREGRYSDAVQHYAKAVELAPDQGALYLVLADALFAAGDYHYGAYAIRRALELDPALIESQIDKHGFYTDPKLFDSQLDELERYLARNPSDRDARLVLALNYLFGGRASDAVRTLLAPGARTDDPAAQRVFERAERAQR